MTFPRVVYIRMEDDDAENGGGDLVPVAALEPIHLLPPHGPGRIGVYRLEEVKTYEIEVKEISSSGPMRARP